MQLSAIHVYPIKSLRGLAVTAARAGAAGLEHDRRWMLVDDDGRFVSLREEPSLARLTVEGVDDGHRVTAPSDALIVPTTHEGTRIPVRVWASTISAVVHEPGSAFFSAYLQRALRLVYLPDDVVRAAGHRARPGDRVSLADAYPYLLIGQASLDGLNARLGGPPLPMSRFRPNLVVSGSEAHAEDGWARLRIGAVPFVGVKLCDRCVMTTVDPWTGDKGVEPLRELAKYRKADPEGHVGSFGRVEKETRGNKVWFGMNLVPDEEGELRVGDEVVVDAYR